jgi:tetratricopeptide (TPR) repeat protein
VRTRALMKRFLHRAIDVSANYADGAERPEAIRRCLPDLEKLHALRPELGVPAMNLHWAYLRLKDAARAQKVLETFVAKRGREPQAVTYFARELNIAGRYADALALLERVAPLNDYLGDEVGIERMRAHAGQGDAKGAMDGFVRRIAELDRDLDHFHFAYHVQVGMGMPSGELTSLWRQHPEALLDAIKAQGAGPKTPMVYPVTLVGLLSMVGRTDDEIEALLAAAKNHRDVFGFQHFFYRSAYRILETGGAATPD